MSSASGWRVGPNPRSQRLPLSFPVQDVQPLYMNGSRFVISGYCLLEPARAPLLVLPDPNWNSSDVASARSKREKERKRLSVSKLETAKRKTVSQTHASRTSRTRQTPDGLRRTPSDPTRGAGSDPVRQPGDLYTAHHIHMQCHNSKNVTHSVVSVSCVNERS